MMRPRLILLALLAAATAFGQDEGEGAPRRTPVAPAEIGATIQFAPQGDLIGPWQAYSVEIDSRTTRTLDLEIRIEDDGALGVATRREQLSPNARKRVFLYAPGVLYSRSVPPRYRITDAAGKRLAAGMVAVSPRSYVQNVYQVGFFCRVPASEEDFGFPAAANGIEIRFARMSLDTFPDRWVGLAALDLLVVHDVALDELTQDQSRALSDYVRQGGTVLLSPGPTKGWLGHPAIAAFAAVKAGPPAPASSLPALNAAFGDFRRAEPFLVQPLLNGEPFSPRLGRDLVRFDHGFGRTFVIGADLRRAPFDTWTGRRAFWTDVLAAAPRWYQDDRHTFPSAATARSRIDLFQQMSRLINPYPSVGLILGLAVFFLAVVGPLNYVALWRLRRTLLLVVTVPVISILFLGLIVGLGYLLKGTSTVVHSARLLSTRAGLDCARELQLFSLFSPSTRSYDVSCDPGTFAEPPARWGHSEDRFYGRRDLLDTITCETGAGFTLRGLGAGQWQSWDLESRAIRDLGKGVRFDVGGSGVRVRNDSTRHIVRGVFVQTGREAMVAPFGEIAPGGQADGTAAPGLTDPVRALGFGEQSLGDRLLRGWLQPAARGPRSSEAFEATKRFLICVVRDDPASIRVDAGLSSRSQTISLLHVAEAP